MIPEEPDGSGHLRKAVLNQLFSGQGLVLRREEAVDRVFTSRGPDAGVLAALVLGQAAREGSPFVYGGLPVMASLRTGAARFSASRAATSAEASTWEVIQKWGFSPMLCKVREPMALRIGDCSSRSYSCSSGLGLRVAMTSSLLRGLVCAAGEAKTCRIRFILPR